MDKKMAKSSTKFSCEDCDYHTSKIFNWNKHLSTRKHKMIKNGKKIPEKVAEPPALPYVVIVENNISSKVGCVDIEKPVNS